MAEAEIGLKAVLDDADFNKGIGNYMDKIGRASQETEQKSGLIGRAMSGMGSIVNIALGVLTAQAIPALINGLTGIVFNTAAAADELVEMSDKTGISTTALQQFKYIGEQTGTSLETVTGSLARLSKNMFAATDGTGPAAEAFKTLGINVLDVNGNLRGNQEVFAEVIDKLGQMTNETERDALAMALFGKSAQELNPLIKAGSAGMAEMAAEAQRLGIVLSEDAINTAAAFNDQWAALKMSFQGIVSQIGVAVIPVLSDLITNVIMPAIPVIVQVAQAFGQWVAGLAESSGAFSILSTTVQTVIATISALIQGFVIAAQSWWAAHGEQITTAMQTAWTTVQTVVRTAIEIIRPYIQQAMTAIGQAIQSVQPAIAAFQQLWVALQPVITVVGAAIAAVVLAVVGVVVGLFTGIAQAIGPFVNTIIQTVTAIVNILSGIITTITGVLQTIWGLITGNQELIKTGTENFRAGLEQIWTNLVDGIVNLVTGLVDTVVNLVSGFVEGIVGFFTSLYDQLVGGSIIVDLVNGAIQWFTTLADTVIAIIQAFSTALVSVIQALAAAITQVITTLVNGVKTIWQTGWAGVQAIFTTITTAIRTALTAFATALSTAITNLLTAVRTLWQAGWTAIQTAFNTVVTAIRTVFTAWTGGLQTAWSGFLSFLQNAWTNGWNAIRNAITNIAGQIRSAVNNIVDGIRNAFKIDWGSIGAAIVNGIVNGIKRNAAKIASAAKSIAQAALAAAKRLLGIGSPSKAFMEVGKNISQGAALGIMRYSALIDKAMRELAATTMGGMTVGIGEMPAQRAAAGLPGMTMAAQPITTNAYRYSTVNMGGVNIYNGTDEQAFQYRLEQTLSRLMGG